MENICLVISICVSYLILSYAIIEDKLMYKYEFLINSILKTIIIPFCILFGLFSFLYFVFFKLLSIILFKRKKFFNEYCKAIKYYIDNLIFENKFYPMVIDEMNRNYQIENLYYSDDAKRAFNFISLYARAGGTKDGIHFLILDYCSSKAHGLNVSEWIDSENTTGIIRDLKGEKC